MVYPSLASQFPSDEIKPSFVNKFRPYHDYDLKRVIRIYRKWARSSSGWLD